MGYISTEEMQERLEFTRVNNEVAASPVIFSPMHDHSDNRRTEDERVLIGTLARLSGSPAATARELGLPRTQVNSYKDGHRCTESQVDSEFLEKINNNVAKLRERIEGKIELAISHITEDKLCNAKAVELAQIAASLSKTTLNIKVEEKVNNNVHFHFFRPRCRAEDEFQVIDVKE
jgi:hypothetical protein